MKIYLASRWDRQAELRKYRLDLETMGHQVTSEWLDQHGGDQSESATPDSLSQNPDAFARYAHTDIKGIMAADLVVVCTAVDGGGWGGHHTEFGVALGVGKYVAIVGPRVNVFHALPYIPVYRDWQHFLQNAYLPIVSEPCCNPGSYFHGGKDAS